jgi:hypothetical protein
MFPGRQSASLVQAALQAVVPLQI